MKAGERRADATFGVAFENALCIGFVSAAFKHYNRSLKFRTQVRQVATSDGGSMVLSDGCAVWEKQNFKAREGKKGRMKVVLFCGRGVKKPGKLNSWVN